MGGVGDGGVAELPGHDDLEGVLHPRAGLDVEGFGELGPVDEGFDVDDGEEVEVGDEG